MADSDDQRPDGGDDQRPEGGDDQRPDDGVERFRRATQSVVLDGHDGRGELRVTLQFEDSEAGTLRFSSEEWIRDTYDVFRKAFLVEFDERPDLSKEEWISLRHYWEQRATDADG